MKYTKDYVKIEDTDVGPRSTNPIRAIGITPTGDVLFIRRAEFLRGYRLRMIYALDVGWLNDNKKHIVSLMIPDGGVIATADDIIEPGVSKGGI